MPMKYSRRHFLKQSTLTAAALALPINPKIIQAGESFVEFLWSGAIARTCAKVNAKLRRDSETVRLLVSRNEDLSAPLYSKMYAANQTVNNRVVSITMTRLTPGTQYFYAIEADGQVDLTQRGKFRTVPRVPTSFSLAFGSCAETGSAHPIFETIRSLNPLFFLHTGDMHYLDISTNDRNLFRAGYDTVLASPTQAALYREVPLVYMWDDHDFGPNDSDSLAPGREASRLTYQEYVPHYPLATGQGNVPIYQAFSIGWVRFIVTDLRSERTPKSAPDDANKSMLGFKQKAWLKRQLLRGKMYYALTVWVSTAAWIPNLSDGWQLYSTERREIADFIKANAITNLVMITGDLHILGIDNGSNSDFATGGGAGFPVFQASPLDRFGFQDGLPFAPYSEGAVAERGQFGLMTVTDLSQAGLTVRWSGRTWANEEVMSYTFRVENKRIVPP